MAMIGPSAPNGPPVPIATAAESGLRNMIFGEIRLRLYSTRSMTSGMPCPRMAAAPKRAISPTITAPIDRNDDGPRAELVGARRGELGRPPAEVCEIRNEPDQSREHSGDDRGTRSCNHGDRRDDRDA